MYDCGSCACACACVYVCVRVCVCVCVFGLVFNLPTLFTQHMGIRRLGFRLVLSPFILLTAGCRPQYFVTQDRLNSHLYGPFHIPPGSQ